MGCSSKHLVAGAYKSGPELLTESLPDWCQTFCDRRAACPEPDVNSDCPSACEKELTKYAANDECAAIGERVKSCMDSFSCQQVLSTDYCDIPEADVDRCAPSDSFDSGDAPTPANVGGSSSGPISGTAGSAAIGAVVSCSDSVTAGGVSSAGSAAGGSTGSIVCEQDLNDCTDGHGYHWICVRGSESQLGCSCFFDSAVTGGFTPDSDGCPSNAAVNAGCGWNLAF